MPEATSPETGTADVDTSFDKGVEEIAALLTDPETPDLQEKDEANADGPDSAEDDPDADAVDAAEEDEPEEVAAGGKFVSRDAKVRLDDGTVISVGDLARNNLYQRDYTRKTEELKAEREAVQAEKTQHSEFAQALAAQREFILSVAQELLPPLPDDAMLDPQSEKFDPIGHRLAEKAYETKLRKLNEVYYQHEADKAQKQGETKAEREKRVKAEQAKMLEAIPEFRTPKGYQEFWTDATDIMPRVYGITVEEIEANPDHRYYKVMRDLVRLHKALGKAPQVKADIQGKPKLLKSGQRMDPKERTSREAQARKEQLRKTGDFEAGVAAIEALI